MIKQNNNNNNALVLKLGISGLRNNCTTNTGPKNMLKLRKLVFDRKFFANVNPPLGNAHGLEYKFERGFI